MSSIHVSLRNSTFSTIPHQSTFEEITPRLPAVFETQLLRFRILQCFSSVLIDPIKQSLSHHDKQTMPTKPLLPISLDQYQQHHNHN